MSDTKQGIFFWFNTPIYLWWWCNNQSLARIWFLGRFPPKLVTFVTACDTLQHRKLLKILRIEMENYPHQHENGNVLNWTSVGINLFNINLPERIIWMLVLFIGTKTSGWIWSFRENSMRMCMDGSRQYFQIATRGAIKRGWLRTE